MSLLLPGLQMALSLLDEECRHHFERTSSREVQRFSTRLRNRLLEMRRVARADANREMRDHAEACRQWREAKKSPALTS